MASSRRVGKKVFDFAKIASRLPEEYKAAFNGFRARYETVQASLGAHPEEPTPIDWNFYKKSISKPGLVDSFQKQYEALSIPYPKDTESAPLEVKQKEMDVHARETLVKSKENLKNLEAELATLKAQKPFEEMTTDEYLEDKPELSRKAYQDMMNHKWYGE